MASDSLAPGTRGVQPDRFVNNARSGASCTFAVEGWPVAVAIRASAPVMPTGIDLGLRAWLFRQRQMARG